ncbi:hypothetical protein HRbin30_00351 [bacterium HR30]|nr:hypothetical protein HRbin30_00351 [bacterium HR30]
MGEIRLKRVYEPPEEEDGLRVLVDRLWPRGLNKDKTRIDFWFKEIAPSEELRRWFGHDPARFPLFKKRYEQELRENAAAVGRLLELVRGNPVVTLLYGARDRERNQAVVIREFLNTALGSKRKSKSR